MKLENVFKLAMVVNGNPGFRNDFGMALEKIGIRTLKAAKGQQCFDVLAAESEPCGLFICDMQLPDLDGIQILTTLRKNQIHGKALAIYTVGSELIDSIPKLLELGLDSSGYMQKPFSNKDFLEYLLNLAKIKVFFSENQRVLPQLMQAKFLEEKKKFREAVKIYESILEDGESPDLLFKFGKTASLSGDGETAKKLFARTLKAEPAFKIAVATFLKAHPIRSVGKKSGAKKWSVSDEAFRYFGQPASKASRKVFRQDHIQTAVLAISIFNERSAIRDMLRRLGVKEIRSFDNAEDAIREANEIEADLFIFDFKLPDLQGDEILKKLNQHSYEGLVHTRSFIINDDTENLKILALLDAGLSGHCVRPYSAFEFSDAIDRMMIIMAMAAASGDNRGLAATALTLYVEELYPMVTKIVQPLLRRNPDDPTANFIQGSLEHLEGNSENAQAYYRAASDLLPPYTVTIMQQATVIDKKLREAKQKLELQELGAGIRAAEDERRRQNESIRKDEERKKRNLLRQLDADSDRRFAERVQQNSPLGAKIGPLGSNSEREQEDLDHDIDLIVDFEPLLGSDVADIERALVTPKEANRKSVSSVEDLRVSAIDAEDLGPQSDNFNAIEQQDDSRDGDETVQSQEFFAEVDESSDDEGYDGLDIFEEIVPEISEIAAQTIDEDSQQQEMAEINFFAQPVGPVVKKFREIIYNPGSAVDKNELANRVDIEILPVMEWVDPLELQVCTSTLPDFTLINLGDDKFSDNIDAASLKAIQIVSEQALLLNGRIAIDLENQLGCEGIARYLTDLAKVLATIPEIELVKIAPVENIKQVKALIKKVKKGTGDEALLFETGKLLFESGIAEGIFTSALDFIAHKGGKSNPDDAVINLISEAIVNDIKTGGNIGEWNVFGPQAKDKVGTDLQAAEVNLNAGVGQAAHSDAVITAFRSANGVKFAEDIISNSGVRIIDRIIKSGGGVRMLEQVVRSGFGDLLLQRLLSENEPKDFFNFVMRLDGPKNLLASVLREGMQDIAEIESPREAKKIFGALIDAKLGGQLVSQILNTQQSTEFLQNFINKKSSVAVLTQALAAGIKPAAAPPQLMLSSVSQLAGAVASLHSVVWEGKKNSRLSLKKIIQRYNKDGNEKVLKLALEQNLRDDHMSLQAFKAIYQELCKSDLKAEAAKFFSQFHHLYCKHQQMRDALAQFLEENKADAHVKIVLEAGSKSHKNDYYYAKGLAVIALKQRDYKEVRRWCIKMMTINPRIGEAYNILGVSLKKQGQVRKAIRIYKKGVLTDPTNSKLLHNLAIAFAAVGLDQDSRAAYRKAQQLASIQNIEGHTKLK